MNKYVSRIMSEVRDNFKNHFDDDEKIWFLEELIEKLQNKKEDLEYNVKQKRKTN